MYATIAQPSLTGLRRLFSLASLVCLFVLIGGCPTGTGDTLGHGENCSRAYLDANYPGEDIDCPSDTVCEKLLPSSTVLTCNAPG